MMVTLSTAHDELLSRAEKLGGGHGPQGARDN